MSRKEKLRILLDTSFILPTLGIDVGDDVLSGLTKLKSCSCDIFVSRFSILESLWIAIRLKKKGKFNEKRFMLGMRSILRGGKYVIVGENPRVFEKALKMYFLGHHDIIDNILYGIADEYNMLLLTVDEELRNFIQKEKMRDVLLFPAEIRF